MRKLILILVAACGLALAMPVSAGPVNVNTADARTLARELDGVGLTRAQAIVAFREKHGPFKSADDLRKVDGIGAATVERNRAIIVVETKPAPKAAAQGG